MSRHGLSPAAMAPIFGTLVTPLLFLGMVTAIPGDVFAEPGVQVLTRGPVHEAFAAASMGGSAAGAVIARAPYEPIAELPPDQRPIGDDVDWIPGYWSWDDDRSDFLWVSGVWRDIPPGRQWVPGYWSTGGNGSQWISGFWGDVTQTEVTYLPPPPEPLEVGPSSPAPSPGTLWAPGSWIWQQTRYDWQPGYWVAQQPNWVWSPAHYSWTPRGHVYVPGYWDHDIAHRGVIFAPVYYDQPVYRSPNYYHSPTIVIDLGIFVTSLFVGPHSHHYYFGDYYDTRYENRGYYPWHSARPGYYGYDPLYIQYRATQLRHDRDWDVHIDEQFRHRRDHIGSRPPQTLDIQVNLINSRSANSRESIVVGRSLTETANRTETQRFAPLSIEERNQIQTRGRGVRDLQIERARMETPTARAQSPGRERNIAEPERLRMPVSPVASRPGGRLERTKTPPAVPDIPRSRAVERTDLDRTRVQDDVRLLPSAPPPSARKPAPRLPGPPESRATRTNLEREKPHPVVKRLDIPVGRSIPTITPPAIRPPVRTSPALNETRSLPPVAVETGRPYVREEPQRTRGTVPTVVRGERGSAGPSRASSTTGGSKGEMRKQPSVNEVQRPSTGAKSQRSKAMQPPAKESPKPKGRAGN